MTFTCAGNGLRSGRPSIKWCSHRMGSRRSIATARWRWCCIVRQAASGRFSKRCGTRGRNPESRAGKRGGLEVPAGYRFSEILRVLVLTEGELRDDAEDAAAGRFEKGAHVPAVFVVVHFDELLPDGAILDFFSGAFEDYS